MTMRRIAALTGTVLAGFVLAGCATATIEDAVPAGALVQSDAESSPMPMAAPHVTADRQTTPPDAYEGTTVSRTSDAYPNLNLQPATAAPQISEQKKTADRAQLRAHQMQIIAEGQHFGVSQDAATLRAQAQDRAAKAQGSPMSNDPDALRRLADRQIEETLKEIEGR